MNRILVACVGVLALAMVVGCESGGSDGDSSNNDNTVPGTTVPNVAGAWLLKDLTLGHDAVIVLTQDGQILSGRVDNFNIRHGVVQGTITSTGLIQMRFIFPRGQTDVTAQVSGNTMTGTWVDHRAEAVSDIIGTRQ